MIDLILIAYFAFGVGMCAPLVTKNRILYRGFLVGKDLEELSQVQYTFFVFFFCMIWPARFFHTITQAFKIENRETGDVLPL